jgi:3-methyl-2-oxobutanoate hydroxymethyltransferase
MYKDQNEPARKPLTVSGLRQMKLAGQRIACLTAYDASFAHCAEQAGVDVVLVGDSLGMVLQGRDSTLAVTVDDIVYHCASVRRGLAAPLLIADMPFMSYATEQQTLHNAGRMLAQGGANMVKLEGAGAVVDYTARLTGLGIPVCGHLGLTPQSFNQLSGYRVQGKSKSQAIELQEDAKALQQAGASLLVLECVPTGLGREISAALEIPVIGIGAGPGCDGQVLVMHDMLGITLGHRPRFVRDFMAGASSITEAMRLYVAAVRDGSYPTTGESFSDQ